MLLHVPNASHAFEIHVLRPQRDPIGAAVASMTLSEIGSFVSKEVFAASIASSASRFATRPRCIAATAWSAASSPLGSLSSRFYNL